MGISPFHLSSSSSEPDSIQPELPNPDPKKFKVLNIVEFGRFAVCMVEYEKVTTFEGRKILVFKDISAKMLKLRTTMDPHFFGDASSPVARFIPTDEGWMMAVLMVNALNNPRRYL